jgi:hypothetical protein
VAAAGRTAAARTAAARRVKLFHGGSWRVSVAGMALFIP